jgi:regulatory protein
MANKQAYTIKQGEALAKQYCVEQERCQKEVFSKLISWGMNFDEADQVIASLISEGFINEQRYAKIYAKSKFNQNKWGRIKIRYSLKQKGISDNCIETGLKEIDQKDYNKLCKALALKKLNSLRAEKILSKKQKTIAFLNSKGFEFEVINNILEEILNE